MILLEAAPGPATAPTTSPPSAGREVQQALDWHYRGGTRPSLATCRALQHRVRTHPDDTDATFALLLTMQSSTFDWNQGPLHAEPDDEHQRILQTLRERGHRGATAILAKMYLKGERGYPHDENRGLPLLNEAFVFGDADAALMLGDLARSSGDLALAHEYYRMAVQRGQVKAWSSLAYALDRAGERDEAIQAFRSGAEAGDPISIYTVGRWHRDGSFASRDPAEARALFREAARRGLPIPAGDWRKLEAAERGALTLDAPATTQSL